VKRRSCAWQPRGAARAPGAPRRRQRGTALLLAMLIVVLVVTLTSGMVWQQTRAVEVEGAERARAQAAWILHGALDWARLILAEDARTDSQRQQKYDALDEPWATPLAEARLSTFLALDRDNNVDTGPEAFLSGRIVDAQSRYNLRNLVDAQGRLSEQEVAGLTRLASAAGLPGDVVNQVALALEPLWAVRQGPPPADLPLTPRRVADLVWLGVAPDRVAALAPWVEILPLRTPVNVNTAPREVLLAAMEGLDMGGAERIVQQRQRQPLRSLEELRDLLGPSVTVEPERVAVVTRHFEITGRLRLEHRVLEERSLVQRAEVARGAEVTVLRRERISLFE
jgi:general secretion pathway protein K